MLKRHLLWAILAATCCTTVWAQPAASRVELRVAAYLDSIRHYPAALTAFFQAMPKGGDLHHHFSGSVYTESLVDAAFREDVYILPATLEIREAPPKQPRRQRRQWLRLSAWAGQVGRYEAERQLLRYWSTLDYEPGEGAAYDDFFSSFPRFDLAADQLFEEGLIEIKKRALADNIQYVETMYRRSRLRDLPPEAANWNSQLLAIQQSQDTASLYALLTEIQTRLAAPSAQRAAEYGARIEAMHQRLALDAPGFALRYQDYVLRVLPPAQVFADLLTAFQTVHSSPLLVGVNIVAPEHDPVALRDYWLHMHFYRFLHKNYPDVRYAMHAGELCLGLTRPEHLRWHIRAAVEVAGAHRIGHGVDIPYEADAHDLLRSLRRRGVAIEINLASNEFILGVAGNRHPLPLYWQAGVPLVICTDDEGVLRTNLTEQYVLLAHRYPEFSYAHIKQLVYNAIRYSFIEEPALKTALEAELDRRFAEFEQKILP
jgi:hypothetical protein